MTYTYKGDIISLQQKLIIPAAKCCEDQKEENMAGGIILVALLVLGVVVLALFEKKIEFIRTNLDYPPFIGGWYKVLWFK